jgi:long-chain acyl-CoA synthetase
MEEKIWHKSYAPGVPAHLDFEKVTIPQALTRTAGRHGNKVALSFQGKGITYRELDAMVNRCARALKALGIDEGDKVAVILPNLPQTVIVNMAVFRIGAVLVLVNPLYTERELTYQLGDSDSVMAVTLSVLVPRILSIMPDTGIKKVVGVQINTYLPFPKKQLFPYVRKQMYRKIEESDVVHDFARLIKAYPPEPVEERSGWEALSTLIYTGGTTGVSKGVMLSHANISCNVQQFRSWFPDLKDGEESLVGTFPIFHSAGFTSIQNLITWAGWKHCVLPRPEPEGVLEILKRDRPTFLPGVPTIFVGCLASQEFREMDLSSIKGFFSGAAPLAADTIRDLKQLTGADMCEVYGLTETSPIVTATPWGGVIKPGTVGVPVPDTEVLIMDTETGERELAQGEIGEIVLKGPQVMMGYYKKPEETAGVLRHGGVYTGDLGFLDPDGYLTIVDRKKDMIIAGGFNIYPVEIDGVLFDHPKILEACTVGVPDAYRGETVKAFVVVKEGETLTSEEVIAYCREKLAAYKVPKVVEFVDSLPKSAVGKILRRELRDQKIARQQA